MQRLFTLLCGLLYILTFPLLAFGYSGESLGSLEVIKVRTESRYGCLESGDLVLLSSKAITPRTKYRVIESARDERQVIVAKISRAQGRRKVMLQSNKRDLKQTVRYCLKKVRPRVTPTVEITLRPNEEKTPTPEATGTKTHTPTISPSATRSSTAIPTIANTNTPTHSPTPTRTATRTATATRTSTPTSASTPTPTRTATNTPTAVPPGNCTTSSSSFQNSSFASQSGSFTAEFDMIPSAFGIDAITALSAAAGSSYDDFAVMVRFAVDGEIDARDGAAYAPAGGIPYSVGIQYHVRLVVNVVSHTYSVFVTPAGGSEITLGTNFAFRSSQSSVSSLSNVGIVSNGGSHQVCNFAITGVPPAPGSLQVNPNSNSTASGSPGGPFSPATSVYTLSNPGTVAINWTASDSATWLDLNSTSGSLAPGAAVQVSATFNAAANSLAIGSYSATINFTNTTNGIGNTSRSLALSVIDPSGQTATSVSRNGFTWTFSQPRQVGQYVTGDWWVVGPVTVTSVSPVPSGGRNGSMKNTPVMSQAFDDRVAYYTPSLAVNYPATLQAGDSLVSALSLNGESICDVSGYCPQSGHAYMRRAEVLTVVSAPQATDAFRPPYISTNRPVFTFSQLQLNLLPRLPYNSKPDLTFHERAFERLWLEILGSDWQGRMLHPIENMPNYGREIGQMTGEGALLLAMNYSDQQMRKLLIGYVQLGIDLYYIVQAGGSFYADGGHGNGRKIPIMIAGRLLNHQGMRSVAGDFGEDEMTYYGQGGRALWGRNCSSPYFPAGCTGNGAKDCKDPAELIDGCEGYRNCCTSPTWVAQALAARLFGAMTYWNHPAFFDYVDRWMSGDVPGGGSTGGDSFISGMWNLYR